MSEQAWLHVVGIGEDGMDGLTPATRAVVEGAEVILGGDRHHQLSDSVTAERIAWPSPFDAMIDTIRAQKGRRFVILVTGDPLWYSVGARIARAFAPDEIVFHPQLSAFQLAACRLGWSLADVATLTVHGRPAEQMIPFIQPGARLLILTTGAETPARIAGFLAERGYGPSRMVVLSAMGGPDEARVEGTAESWSAQVPAFNTMAVEVRAGDSPQVMSSLPGLPDDAFAHDGQITKSEVRALTVARLMPMRGQLLWDIGCGCGSVAIEWMRAARDARAIGLEPDAGRRALAAENALRLGAPRLDLRDGRAPEGLDGLPAPDAVFIGGGFSVELAERALAALKPQGRLVANAVTLESEAALAAALSRHGGTLVRLAVARADTLGAAHRGWRPMMPVTQWSLVKR